MTASSWPALVKAALLGTERTGRPSTGPPAEPPERETQGSQVDLLFALVATDPGRSAERILLGAAAAVATARRAGRRPERVEAAPPAPAPPVDRPEAGEDASRSLAALLGGTWRQLLAEWLEACGATGRRVPSVWLPAVLDVATADRAVRPAVLGALGERGRWLAAQRPAWSWAGGAAAGEVPADPVAAWAEGTAAERRDLLAAARATDPALGRALVESTWSVDRADDRSAFVERLATGLSLDDEPFLEERALADRGRDVRRAAASVLARLPASRLCARMQERAAGHVALAGGGRSGPAVRLPGDLPPEWAADGVDRPARRGIGERAWWLAQVVSAAPLDAWGPAAGAVAAARAAEHGDAVLLGWATAATRQRRGDWAAALLAAPEGSLPTEAPALLLRVLDQATRSTWLARAIEAAPRQGAGPLLGLAGEVPRPWPAPLVRAVAGRAAAAVLGFGPQAHAARPALLLVAERADPATLDRLLADLASAMQADRRLQAELRRPLALAQLRKDLLAELR